MRGYRGKHRKSPASARPIGSVMLVGALASAPLLMAAPADAAPEATWDKVAQCESGGQWNAATDNGYYGGLQFAPSTWTGFGGGEFAPMAHQATREQQIEVAERVLAAQGWNAWGACGQQAGAVGEPATELVAPGPES
jgi:hypothetical protein